MCCQALVPAPLTASYCYFNHNLNGGTNFTPPCWFFLNNSETLNAVTLTFCSIQQNFIRDVCAKVSIPILTQYQNIRQNLDKGIWNFQLTGQSLIKENGHNT